LKFFILVFNSEFLFQSGGFGQPNDYDLTPNFEDSVRILRRCVRLWPDLHELAELASHFADLTSFQNHEFDSAEQKMTAGNFLSHHVGLRPARAGGVRLEIDDARSNSSEFVLIHNYGHAGEGVTLSWVRFQSYIFHL
jgi:hypothetical protein